MAKLFINKDIASDSDKMKYWLSGEDCVSFSEIQGFLDWMSQDDNRIDVELHSCGGDCVEGYAIYDALRASGKEISCTVVGMCASMATVILLAAPKERRSMYEHAQLLIHSPYLPSGSVNQDLTIGKLNELVTFLADERKKMLNVYVERTEVDASLLEAQMQDGGWFGSDKAIELGFVSSVVPKLSAKVEKPIINSSSSLTKSKKEMKKEDEKPTVAEAFRMLGVALGITKPNAVSMVITTSTGDELTVEREEGEIQVGDAASPDGEHVLEDGRTVVVTDGVITEIREAEEGEEDTTTEELEARIKELEKEVEDLKSNAKTEEETRILASVKKAGGEKWLNKVASSTYTPAGRTTQIKKTVVEEPKSVIRRRLEEAREKNRKKTN